MTNLAIQIYTPAAYAKNSQSDKKIKQPFIKVRREIPGHYDDDLSSVILLLN